MRLSASPAFCFLFFAVMLAATLVATPFVVRTSLRGLEEAARKARQIDPDRRGTRLPLEGVPGEIGPLVEAVNDALERLDQGIERRQRFLADAAHELRTPIAILTTRLEGMPDSPERRTLLRDAARLAMLAEQLLDVERLDRTEAVFARLDLVAMLRRSVADLAPLAIASGRSLSLDCDAGEVMIKGDPSALERVVANLVQNALRHAGSGAITVRLETSPQAGAMIDVCDEGPDIPAGLREQVFEPFQRLTTTAPGAGLGLHLAAQIVRIHGGTIRIIDAPGGGACFRVILPHIESRRTST